MGHESRYELHLVKYNPIVVRYNFEVIGNTVDGILSANYDSYIVETGAHFPTDINLFFFDTVRKTTVLIMALSSATSFDRFSRLITTLQNNTGLRS